MQFIPGGDLGKILQQQCYLQQDKARNILAEIVLAIQHLHNSQIIHRDLKPQNLVIDQNGHLKLTDFGLSQIQIQDRIQQALFIKNSILNSKTSTVRKRRAAVVKEKSSAKLLGTPDYIAPQILNGISIDNKSIDWWSLGIMAYQILIGVKPFCGKTIQQVVDNILRFNIQWPQIGTQQGMISQNAFDLVKKLLNFDFINRLGTKNVQQIKNHSFFKNIDWNNLKKQKSSIAPNQKRYKQLFQLKQNLELRKEILQKVGQNNNENKFKLDSFVRFDILGQKTLQEANIRKNKKQKTLTRLISIKNIIQLNKQKKKNLNKSNKQNKWIKQVSIDIDSNNSKNLQYSFSQFQRQKQNINRQ